MNEQHDPEPKPAENFLDLLLKSEDVVFACRATNFIAQAKKGDAKDFLAWFEEWRSDREPVEQVGDSMQRDSGFCINIYSKGPIYRVLLQYFNNAAYSTCWIGYFDSKIKAKYYAMKVYYECHCRLSSSQSLRYDDPGSPSPYVLSDPFMREGAQIESLDKWLVAILLVAIVAIVALALYFKWL